MVKDLSTNSCGCCWCTVIVALPHVKAKAVAMGSVRIQNLSTNRQEKGICISSPIRRYPRHVVLFIVRWVRCRAIQKVWYDFVMRTES